MAQLVDGVVIEGLEELQRKLNPEVWWQAIERLIPRALVPTVIALKSAAPRGRSGKLARGFDVRVRQIGQGIVQGVEATVGARVPYGHLVEEGHQIIPRGPTRKGSSSGADLLGLLRRVGVQEFQRRLQSQKAGVRLKARRARGAIGFVPGRPFARPTAQTLEPQMVALLEKLLEGEIQRA